MHELGWSNLPLLPALPGMSRPWACHQSLAEGAQVVPAARERREQVGEKDLGEISQELSECFSAPFSTDLPLLHFQ